MREISVPALVTADPRANLTELVTRAAAEAPDAVLFSRPGAGGWEDVTSSAFLGEVTRLAKGLVAAGVQPGDRVGLMSKTRYEWTLTDFAIWFAGGVTVPVYETSSAEQVSWILSDSGAVAIVTETAAHTATVEQVREGLPALASVWCVEAGDLTALADRGSSIGDDEIERRRATLQADSVATLIYTSGTTGRPKGCELTHGNFRELALNAVAHLSEVVCAPGASTLLFLPLAHVFARFVQILCVAARARMGHSADVKNLVADLGEFKPTFVLAVPRVFEKIYNSAEATAEAGGKGRIFRAAVDTAIAHSTARDQGGPGLALRARHALFDRLVYAKLRTRLGGQIQYAVSGGAPLGARLGHFFRGAGILVLEGWGLTETTAPATVNTPSQIRIGSVGRPLPGVAVRVGDDGELLVRGINIMKGYFNNAEATADALEDGWLHTGDLGEVDEGGFVRITGRKKEIIVTAGGKNVAPTVLEDRLRAHVLVSQCMVVGDQRPFIAALITLDAEALPLWLESKGKPADTPLAQLVDDPDVKAELDAAVADANKAVSQAEAIKKYRVLATDFTEDNGMLTPSLKLKRSVVIKEFSAEVDALYTR